MLLEEQSSSPAIFFNYLAVIIVGVIGALILLTVMTMCLCKNLSFCPMNAAKSTCSTAQGIQQRYRPVDTLSRKPVTYEGFFSYQIFYTLRKVTLNALSILISVK
ncbi:hypothetical protein WUBG_04058 [Wuchereria bancrofti]|uniref:Uncharacterized protein n=1 Tax=Wuchereria bancrofti TaxID=6293 RepID=J9F6C3_WUCBA|nr:hypothetical protein WUBG_04058 [Wuchereria bancrofti]